MSAPDPSYASARLLCKPRDLSREFIKNLGVAPPRTLQHLKRVIRILHDVERGGFTQLSTNRTNLFQGRQAIARALKKEQGYRYIF